ncbi:MAG: 23S rRNA (adenine(2503)-C(2))-methyltransferase RlmN [Thermodesulfobacteriota bacterium]
MKPIWYMNLAEPLIDIKNLNKNQLLNWLAEQKIERFRADQIFKWIYLRQADHFDQMTDLGKSVRSRLTAAFFIERLPVERIETSCDGSRKYLFRLSDGNRIETVLIPEKSHHTLCVSTQVGCAQGCRFCMTARQGFVRNLRTGEIIAQIRDVQQHMASPAQLKNIVFMGMGEPLANFDNLLSAIDIITDGDSGLKFSTRRVTVSTAGMVPKISSLGQASTVNLAISLNATDNKTRSMLMPINRAFPIEELLEACAHYPLSHRRKITIEYILIRDLNDSLENARRLSDFIRRLKAKINLIPFNEHPGCEFKTPTESTVETFLKFLHDRGHTAIVRYSKGRDISAACGQLRADTALEY